MTPQEDTQVWTVVGELIGAAVAEQINIQLAPIRKDIMATQANIDALTATVTQVSADLATAQATIQAELDALAAANPTLDVTALTAAVALLDPEAQKLNALVPDPPVTPPAS